MANLVLSRRDRFHDEGKSKVNIYGTTGELLGHVSVQSASHGTARLAFDMPAEYRIVRHEVDCREGGDGKDCQGRIDEAA